MGHESHAKRLGYEIVQRKPTWRPHRFYTELSRNCAAASPDVVLQPAKIGHHAVLRQSKEAG